MLWTPELLAALPRWDREKTLALPGTARGDLLGPWGTNLVARFGTDALVKVRRHLPLELAPVLTENDFVPVYAQLLLTEAIADEFFAGNIAAIYPALVEDTKKGLGRIKHAGLRALGASTAFKIVPKVFNKVHERGNVTLDAGERRVRLTFTGTPQWTHPTWRAMQLMATKCVLELANEKSPTVTGEDHGDDAFVVNATWG